MPAPSLLLPLRLLLWLARQYPLHVLGRNLEHAANRLLGREGSKRHWTGMALGGLLLSNVGNPMT